MRRLVASLAVSAACAAPAAAREWLDEVRAAIEAQNRRLAEAVSRGDEDAAAAVYADDARLMPPNAKTIEDAPRSRPTGGRNASRRRPGRRGA